jgi:hypothetical protein
MKRFVFDTHKPRKIFQNHCAAFMVDDHVIGSGAGLFA